MSAVNCTFHHGAILICALIVRGAKDGGMKDDFKTASNSGAVPTTHGESASLFYQLRFRRQYQKEIQGVVS
jgi:hypothetical protein